MLSKSDLHPYQQRVVTELYERAHVMLVAPMGAGKTASTLTAFHELQRDGVLRKAIILAPKRVALSVWPSEPPLWDHLQHLRLSSVSGTPEQRTTALDDISADIYVVGIDNVQWLTEQMRGWDDDDPRLDLLVIDELSRFKGPTGKRARALSMVSERFANRWGLTGTPMPNSEVDLYQPARIIARWTIWPEPFLDWRMNYFKPDNPVTQFNWDIREEWRDKIWNDVARFSVVVRDDELPPQPDMQSVFHMVDLPPKALKAYREMERDLVIEAGGETLFAENMGVATGKLEQIVQGFVYKDGETLTILHDAKKRMLADLLQSVGGQQVMVTYWFKEDLVHIRDVVGDQLAVLGAETKDSDVERIVGDWNVGRIKTLAVHPASAGHGLNLQKGHAAQIIHFCLTWSPELYEQVIKRIARQGNKAARVFNHFIMARNTLDTVKRERVVHKLTRQDAFKVYIDERRNKGT